MKISEAKFIGSSTRVTQKPKQKLPEFAFIGRSNVGKSSLINTLCNNSSLAKTSSTPGKTKLINHFMINGAWYLVDLPGYGYAKLDAKGREELSAIIRDYISKSEEMIMMFVLVDSRRDIGKTDLDFINNLGAHGIPFAIIYTKCDKQGPNILKAQLERNEMILGETWDELPMQFVSSSQDRRGREEILNYIESILQTI